MIPIVMSVSAKRYRVLAVLAFLMAMVSCECDLWPGDPSLSACSAGSMFRLNAQRTGRSPFAGPGWTRPRLYSQPSVAMPIAGPSYLGDTSRDVEGAPFFVEAPCSQCGTDLVMERPFNSTGDIAAAGLDLTGYAFLSLSVLILSWLRSHLS